MKSMILAIAIVAGLSGCASITGDTTQMVRLETVDAKGESVKGAKCTLQNDFGILSGDSGAHVVARRSSKDLHIECKKEGFANANAVAVSRANAGMAGNILFGGGIGAIIDHNKGTAYTYPEWMKLVFGKMLTFDRSDDKEAQPSLAKSTPAATLSPEVASAK